MAININELQALLNQASIAVENEKDIRKGLTRIENLLSNIHKEVANVYALLDSAAPAKKSRQPAAPTELDAEAPYGRKKDGSPRAKSGRSRTAQVAA
ncbi:MAG: hypothetical protein ACRYFV_07490 [Janthinobacterium lividum]